MTSLSRSIENAKKDKKDDESGNNSMTESGSKVESQSNIPKSELTHEDIEKKVSEIENDRPTGNEQGSAKASDRNESAGLPDQKKPKLDLNYKEQVNIDAGEFDPLSLQKSVKSNVESHPPTTNVYKHPLNPVEDEGAKNHQMSNAQLNENVALSDSNIAPKNDDREFKVKVESIIENGSLNPQNKYLCSWVSAKSRPVDVLVAKDLFNSTYTSRNLSTRLFDYVDHPISELQKSSSNSTSITRIVVLSALSRWLIRNVAQRFSIVVSPEIGKLLFFNKNLPVNQGPGTFYASSNDAEGDVNVRRAFDVINDALFDITPTQLIPQGGTMTYTLPFFVDSFGGGCANIMFDVIYNNSLPLDNLMSVMRMLLPSQYLPLYTEVKSKAWIRPPASLIKTVYPLTAAPQVAKAYVNQLRSYIEECIDVKSLSDSVANAKTSAAAGSSPLVPIVEVDNTRTSYPVKQFLTELILAIANPKLSVLVFNPAFPNMDLSGLMANVWMKFIVPEHVMERNANIRLGAAIAAYFSKLYTNYNLNNVNDQLAQMCYLLRASNNVNNNMVGIQGYNNNPWSGGAAYAFDITSHNAYHDYKPGLNRRYLALQNLVQGGVLSPVVAMYHLLYDGTEARAPGADPNPTLGINANFKWGQEVFNDPAGPLFYNVYPYGLGEINNIEIKVNSLAPIMSFILQYHQSFASAQSKGTRGIAVLMGQKYTSNIANVMMYINMVARILPFNMLTCLLPANLRNGLPNPNQGTYIDASSIGAANFVLDSNVVCTDRVPITWPVDAVLSIMKFAPDANSLTFNGLNWLSNIAPKSIDYVTRIGLAVKLRAMAFRLNSGPNRLWDNFPNPPGGVGFTNVPAKEFGASIAPIIQAYTSSPISAENIDSAIRNVGAPLTNFNAVMGVRGGVNADLWEANDFDLNMFNTIRSSLTVPATGLTFSHFVINGQTTTTENVNGGAKRIYVGRARWARVDTNNAHTFQNYIPGVVTAPVMVGGRNGVRYTVINTNDTNGNPHTYALNLPTIDVISDVVDTTSDEYATTNFTDSGMLTVPVNNAVNNAFIPPPDLAAGPSPAVGAVLGGQVTLSLSYATAQAMLGSGTDDTLLLRWVNRAIELGFAVVINWPVFSYPSVLNTRTAESPAFLDTSIVARLTHDTVLAIPTYIDVQPVAMVRTPSAIRPMVMPFLHYETVEGQLLNMYNYGDEIQVDFNNPMPSIDNPTFNGFQCLGAGIINAYKNFNLADWSKIKFIGGNSHSDTKGVFAI
jgi:hypothetical protein